MGARAGAVLGRQPYGVAAAVTRAANQRRRASGVAPCPFHAGGRPPPRRVSPVLEGTVGADFLQTAQARRPGGPAGEPADADVAASADVTAADEDAAWELFDGAGGFIDGDDDDSDASPSDLDSEDDADAEGMPHSAFDPFDGADDGEAADWDDGEDDGGSDSAADTGVPLPATPPAAGGDVRAYVDAVIALGRVPPLAVVAAMFGYTLDPFQRRAVAACLGRSNVLVCAPTGAGKTAIAAAAALGTLAAGRRVIYTTPLKALSNQKLLEFRELFGAHRVGLQTGDASLNPGGDVVVMTTEVLRNILFRSASPDDGGRVGSGSGAGASDDVGVGDGPDGGPAPPAGERATSQGATPLGAASLRAADVGLIVLDEVHYLGDEARGTVWEEVIISAPPSARLLAMSATVRNPGDLGGWVSAVHGPCVTLRTAERPVPLTWKYAWTPRLRAGDPPSRRARWVATRERQRGRAKSGGSSRGDGDVDGHGWPYADGEVEVDGSDDDGDDSVHLDDLLATPRAEKPSQKARLNPALRGPPGGKPPPRSPPDAVGTAAALRARGLLPAIWFIFSRAACDATAVNIAASGVVDIGPAQRAAVDAALAVLEAEQPEAVRSELVPALRRGVASHHAGCLPGWKALVERLFQGGALQLVLATETLAAGINMPARTTVISALARRRTAGAVGLTHNELLQMAGRAGRRGYDTTGTCVVLHTLSSGPAEAARLVARRPERLTSQFRPGYSMVLNLAATRPLAAARAFVERSYGRYLAEDGRRRREAAVAAAEAAAADAEAAAERAAAAAAAAAGGVVGVNKEARRALKDAQRRAVATRATRAAALLRGAATGLPRMVLLDLGADDAYAAEAVPALAVRVGMGPPLAGDVAMPRELVPGEPAGEVLCLLDDNRVARVQFAHVAGVAPAPAPSTWLDGGGGATTVKATIESAALAAGTTGGWKGVPGGALAAACGGLTARLAASMQGAGWPDPLPPSAEDDLALRKAKAEVRAQRAASRRAKKVDAWALRGRPAPKPAAARAAAVAAAEAHAARRQANIMRAALQEGLEATWRSFEAALSVLIVAGAVQDPAAGKGLAGPVDAADEAVADESARLTLLPLGEVARSLFCENELWMATLLSSDAVQTLSPSELAGAVSAVVAGELGLRPGVRAAYPPSEKVAAALAALDPVRASLARAQFDAGLDAPLAVDLRLAGVVEAWAAGLAWDQAVVDCTLDPGDVARLMQRVVDLLRQARHCDALPPGLRGAARRAARAMDRAPIADTIE